MINKMDDFELITCIVNNGLGSKVLRLAKTQGVTGGTICIGRGTVKNRLLEILDLNDVRKEIVIMVAEAEAAQATMLYLRKELHLDKPDHGIVYSMSLGNFIGTKHYEYVDKRKGLEKKTMHNIIYTIVNKGLAEEVIDAATRAGSKGGTIINARGSGINEHNMLFSMVIEPEKEIVMIISENDSTEAIVDSIRSALNIDKPGNGVIFVSGIKKVYGIK